MGQLKEGSSQPGFWEELVYSLRRLEAERFQEKGWQEPYEPRGSRTDLWGTGGEIPPVYPAVTLGDLLGDLLAERLGGWAEKDAKTLPWASFLAEWPDVPSRLSILGSFALRCYAFDDMEAPKAREALESIIKASGANKPQVLSKEAFEFLDRSGLISVQEKIRFPIRGLFEFLCGHGLARAWHDGEDPHEELSANEWRIVAFAATAARRGGYLAAIRKQLLSFLRDKLLPRALVTQCCYIVVESRDVELAQAVFSRASAVERRPLDLARHEWHQSAVVIAEAIKISGRGGFDWFYETYLDPRMPEVHLGSMIPADVFASWALLSVSSLDPHEADRLSALVRPTLAADSMRVVTMIPYLALLLPKRFSERERLWFCSKLLERGDSLPYGLEKIKQAFEGGHQDLVNEILIHLCHSGGSIAIRAAELWLSLNPDIERPPTSILRAVARARESRYLEKRRVETSKPVVDRIGEATWERFLRWSLSDADAHVAAGAAIELYERGDRRLLVLGKALARGMHDGGYVRRAEEVLHQLVEENGAAGTTWIAERIAKNRDGNGACSGLWRILLAETDWASAESRDLYDKTLAALGPFTLVRYAEVRQTFRALLSGTHGDKISGKLQELMQHPDPATRLGAATVLVACGDGSDPLALETVLRLRPHMRYGGWHEWESYLLSLSFGPSTLASIQAKLPRFHGRTRSFALAILRKNGVTLSKEELREFLPSLLIEGFWVARVMEFGQQEGLDSHVREVLTEIVSEEAGDAAVTAANVLVSNDVPDAGSKLAARCALLAIHEERPGQEWLEREVKLLLEQPEYREVVKNEAEKLVAVGLRPFLEDVRLALETKKWDQVVWRLLCDASRFRLGADVEGQLLLDLGMKIAAFAGPIGESCKRLLADKGVQGGRHAETQQWLAIIADEFSVLAPTEMSNALLSGHAIHRAVTAAILARLGEPPAEFMPPPSSAGATPRAFHRDPDPSVLADSGTTTLVELGRNATELDKQTCSKMEAFLLFGNLNTKDLRDLASRGWIGVIIAGNLSFAMAGTSPADSLFVLDSIDSIQDSERDLCWQRLKKGWLGGYLPSIAFDEDTRNKYAGMLGQILTEKRGDTGFVALQLMRMTSSLSASQVPIVLETYASEFSRFDDELAELVSPWFASRLPDETLKQTTRACITGLEILDNLEWTPQKGSRQSAVKLFFFPFLHWALSRTESTLANRVLLRGLRASLDSAYASSCDLPSTLGVLDPLLRKVPRDLLQSALLSVSATEIPTVHALAYLVSGLKK